MSEQSHLEIIPTLEGWAVTRDGDPVLDSSFKTQAAAIQHARKLSREAGAEFVVYGNDGRIRETSIRPKGYGALKDAFSVRDGIDITRAIYQQVIDRGFED